MQKNMERRPPFNIMGMQDVVGDQKELCSFGTLFSFTQRLSLIFSLLLSNFLSTQIRPPLKVRGTPAFIEVGEKQIWIKWPGQQNFQFRSIERWKSQRPTLNTGIPAFNDPPRYSCQDKGIFPQ